MPTKFEATGQHHLISTSMAATILLTLKDKGIFKGERRKECCDNRLLRILHALFIYLK